MCRMINILSCLFSTIKIFKVITNLSFPITHPAPTANNNNKKRDE